MFASCKEENKLFGAGYKFIAGIDEVGRGALAGPVSVAIVIFNKNSFDKIKNLKLKDSKHLTEKQREKFSKIIKRFAKEIKITNISNKIIDKININNALNLALEKVFKKLRNKPEFLLLDGGLKIKSKFKNQKSKFRQKTIIKGDEKCVIIAAASIIAKVCRDNLMKKLTKKYPQYKFERHKGYGTKLHFKMIKKYGISKIHRKTFLKSLT